MHFEILILTVFFSVYYITIDSYDSIYNALDTPAQGFWGQDEDSLDSNMSAEDLKTKYRRTYAERSQARVVFILFKEDGTGGIQGILVDSFYIN